MTDVVHHPSHYARGRFSCECIEITRRMPFVTGSAFKYVFRFAEKNGVEDLRKAAVYLRWGAEDDLEPWLPGWDMPGNDLIVEHVLAPLSAGEYPPVYDALVLIGLHGDYRAALELVESAIREYEAEPVPERGGVDVTWVAPGALEKMLNSDAGPSPKLRAAIERARERRTNQGEQ